MYISKSTACCSVCFRSPIKNPGLSLHKFPSQRGIKKRWMEACGCKDSNCCVSQKVCSLHFEPKCISIVGKKKRLFYGSVPTIFSKEDIEKNIAVYEKLGLMGEHLHINIIQQIKEEQIKKEKIKQEQNIEKYMGKRILRSSVSGSPNNTPPTANNIMQVKQEISQEQQTLELSVPGSSNIMLPTSKNIMQVKQEISQEQQILESLELGPSHIMIPTTSNGNMNKESNPEATGRYCPQSMFLYENGITHPRIWLCKICHAFLLNRERVDQHLGRCKRIKYVNVKTLI